MKRRYYILFLTACMLLALSCKNNSTSSEPDPPDPPGNPSMISKDIGSSGGSITSSDSLLTLTIPPGALSGTETITIEEVSPDDLGSEFDDIEVEQAYEMGPDGLEFDMPIIATFMTDQNPIAGPDSTSGAFSSEFLLTSDNGIVTELENLQTMADLDAATVVVTGELRHFSPLTRTFSQPKTGAIAKFEFTLLPNPIPSGPDIVTTNFLAEITQDPNSEGVMFVDGIIFRQNLFQTVLEAVDPGEGDTEVQASTSVGLELDYRCPGVGFAERTFGLVIDTESTAIGPNDTPAADIFGAIREVGECVEEMSPTFNLQIALDGNGSGSVSSDVAGINCPGDCEEDYEEDTMVTLTATPDQGSEFVVWSGDIGSNPPQDSVITVTMDQARTVTATFNMEQPGGTTGVSSSGTAFPRAIIKVPNPWGPLNFDINCPFVLFFPGADLGVVDPCTGNTIAVLDITFEISSTGLNGGIALEPIEDANGETRNWLLLTTQSQWFIAEIVLDNVGIPQFGEFRGLNIREGFIFDANPNVVGGTSFATVVGRNVQVVSADPTTPGGYTGVGQNLDLSIVNESGTIGQVRQAHIENNNGMPGNIVGVAQFSENGSPVIRPFYAIRNMDGTYNVIVGDVIGESSSAFTCHENPNPSPPENEANLFCGSVDDTRDIFTPLALKFGDPNSLQVLPEIPTGTSSPSAVTSRLTPDGDMDFIIPGFFGGDLFRFIIDFSGNMIASGTGSYPSGIDGVGGIVFDCLNPERAILVSQNNDVFGIINLPAPQPVGN